MDEDKIKTAVADTMSDFYNDVIKKRFDHVDFQLSDLKLTNEALVKVVDYARLEAKVIE